MSSVPGLILEAVLRHNKQDALNYRAEGKWHNIPAATFVERVKNVTLGLASLGVRPGDRIALLSENRPEWSITDLAILSLGAINVPIYTTQALEQVDYILSDSGARAIFTSTRRLYKHAQPVLANRRLEHLIFFEPEEAATLGASTVASGTTALSSPTSPSATAAAALTPSSLSFRSSPTRDDVASRLFVRPSA